MSLQYLEHMYTKKHFFFVWNSNLTWCPEFYVAPLHTQQPDSLIVNICHISLSVSPSLFLFLFCLWICTYVHNITNTCDFLPKPFESLHTHAPFPVYISRLYSKSRDIFLHNDRKLQKSWNLMLNTYYWLICSPCSDFTVCYNADL